MDFNNCKALPKYSAYSLNYYLLYNFTNTLLFTFACKNTPMKYDWWTLALFLVASTKKYFSVLMEAVGDQVSPTNSLFFRYPLTTILNFNLSRLLSYWILAFYTYIHIVTGSILFGSSIRKFWLLIRFLISFRVAFSQCFFLLSDNFVTSEKFLGSGMKWETSDPDSPRGGNLVKFLLQQS